MSKIRRPTLLIPTPPPFVRSVLSKVGLACGAAYTGRPSTSTPFWSHSLIDYGMNVMGWKQGVVSYMHWLHVGIRKRAIRKAERLAKRE
jgi:17beta-estradiol 17-dehydrogenase / very-long-chain 3-oxoacyl-CoA reductase